MGPSLHESEFIINSDGTIYHLNLKPHEIAETIITVGDPERVAEVSKYFDSIQHKAQHREFIVHTGYLNNKRLTVLSTGMGTDNIDIVLNELDALVNIDFNSRTIKEDLTSLNIIRLGTSGSLSEEIPVDSILISEIAIGLDSLLSYYDYENSIQETVYLEAFSNYIIPYFKDVKPYLFRASENLLKQFDTHYSKGMTVTAGGFYGPQGRKLRIKRKFPKYIEILNRFRHQHFRITNLEMETAGIYGLGKLLGHNCLSVNAILANRIHHSFSAQPAKVIDRMIQETLEIVVSSSI